MTSLYQSSQKLTVIKDTPSHNFPVNNDWEVIILEESL